MVNTSVELANLLLCARVRRTFMVGKIVDSGFLILDSGYLILEYLVLRRSKEGCINFRSGGCVCVDQDVCKAFI